MRGPLSPLPILRDLDLILSQKGVRFLTGKYALMGKKKDTLSEGVKAVAQDPSGA